MTRVTPRVVVAGLGSEYRRDDGVGPLIATRAVDEAGFGNVIGPLVDPLDLLGAWDGADVAVVVDAVRSGVAPGTLTLVELTGALDDALDDADHGGPHGATSTHGIGLAGVLRLARAIDRAPARVVVVGVEGEDFGRGTGLSPAVESAVPAAVRRVVDVIKEGRACV